MLLVTYTVTNVTFILYIILIFDFSLSLLFEQRIPFFRKRIPSHMYTDLNNRK